MKEKRVFQFEQKSTGRRFNVKAQSLQEAKQKLGKYLRESIPGGSKYDEHDPAEDLWTPERRRADLEEIRDIKGRMDYHSNRIYNIINTFLEGSTDEVMPIDEYREMNDSIGELHRFLTLIETTLNAGRYMPE